MAVPTMELNPIGPITSYYQYSFQ